MEVGVVRGAHVHAHGAAEVPEVLQRARHGEVHGAARREAAQACSGARVKGREVGARVPQKGFQDQEVRPVRTSYVEAKRPGETLAF